MFNVVVDFHCRRPWSYALRVLRRRPTAASPGTAAIVDGEVIYRAAWKWNAVCTGEGMRLRLAALSVVLAAALVAACGARADLDPYGVPVRKSAAQQSSSGARADAGSDAGDAESDGESD
jgi:hypothetical protein